MQSLQCIVVGGVSSPQFTCGPCKRSLAESKEDSSINSLSSVRLFEIDKVLTVSVRTSHGNAGGGCHGDEFSWVLLEG